MGRPFRFQLTAIGLVALSAVLVACVSNSGHQPGDPVVVDRNSIPPDASSPNSSNPSSRAVADLIVGSQREYDSGDWQSAIAVAERALRIDRRQPGVYLLLAKSYRAMGEPQQALQFVEQGQRYLSDDDSPVARELNWLAEALR